MALALDRDRMTSGGAVRLTGREVEILCLVSDGRSSSEVADSVFVSKRTIDFHLANVYKKLGVRNRIRALNVAARLGLIPAEPTIGVAAHFREGLELQFGSSSQEPFAPSPEGTEIFRLDARTIGGS